MDILEDKNIESGDEEKIATQDPKVLAVIEEMMRAGIFLGRKSSKTHPKMRPFVFGSRNGASMIDLEETLRLLDEAMEFIKEKISHGDILLVGSTPTAKALIEETAKKLGLPYVTERWLGGTLTNYKTLSKRVAYFKKLKSDKEAGRLNKYTKKERLGFDREIEKMTTMFSGVENMNKLPEVLFVVDVNSNMTAVREAIKLNIPVVAMVNTDTNPDLVQYIIPANDRSKQSVEWVLNHFVKAIEEGKKNIKAAETKSEAADNQ